MNKLIRQKTTFLNLILFSTILVVALFVGGFFSPRAVSALANKISDENLRQCIVDEYNSQNGTIYTSIDELNLAEIEELRCRDYGILSLSGIGNLENLNYFDVENNNIDSVGPLLELSNLEALFISGNHLNTSPLRSFDENTLAAIRALLQKGVTVEGIDDQALDYNQELANGKPKLKFLFVYVVDVDADYTVNGEPKHYQHTLTNTEIKYFDALRQQFEQVTEKLSNYRFDVVTDVYYTTKPYGFSSNGVDEDYEVAWIDEIDNGIRDAYDTVVVNAFYAREIPHNASGLGNRGNAMAYYNIENESTYNDRILKIQKHIVDGYIGTLVHESIHSLECYGFYVNQNIWEWHTATAYYTAALREQYGPYMNGQEMTSESYYLQGMANPENPEETGVTDAIIHLPYSRLLEKQDSGVVSSVDSVSLSVGDQEQLYALSKLPEDTWNKEAYALYSFSDIEWSSADQNIATVDNNGLVTAKKGGKTNILAKSKHSEDIAIVEIEVIGDSTEDKNTEDVTIVEIEIIGDSTEDKNTDEEEPEKPSETTSETKEDNLEKIDGLVLPDTSTGAETKVNPDTVDNVALYAVSLVVASAILLYRKHRADR